MRSRTSRALGDRARVGSSAGRRRACGGRARASATRCLRPFEAGRAVVASGSQVEEIERLVHAARGSGRSQPGVAEEVATDSEAIPEAGRFRQDADAWRRRGAVRLDTTVADAHLARGWRNDPRQHPQR